MWEWSIQTRDASQKIVGECYGTFQDAVDDLPRAIRFHGWGHNSSDVTIALLYVEPKD